MMIHIMYIRMIDPDINQIVLKNPIQKNMIIIRTIILMIMETLGKSRDIPQRLCEKKNEGKNKIKNQKNSGQNPIQ